MIRINLLPKEERKLKSTAVRWEFLVVVLGVVILIGGLGYYITQASTLSSLRSELRSLKNNTMILQQQAANVNRRQEEVQRLAGNYETYGRLVQKRDLIDQKLFDRLMESNVDNLWLEQVSKRDAVLEIQGYSLELAMLHRFVQGLNNQGFKASILSFSKHPSLPLNTFVIEAQRRR